MLLPELGVAQLAGDVAPAQGDVRREAGPGAPGRPGSGRPAPAAPRRPGPGHQQGEGQAVSRARRANGAATTAVAIPAGISQRSCAFPVIPAATSPGRAPSSSSAKSADPGGAAPRRRCCVTLSAHAGALPGVPLGRSSGDRSASYTPPGVGRLAPALGCVSAAYPAARGRRPGDAGRTPALGRICPRSAHTLCAHRPYSLARRRAYHPEECARAGAGRRSGDRRAWARAGGPVRWG